MKWSFLLQRWKDLASIHHTSGSMKYSISICSNSRERKRNCLQQPTHFLEPRSRKPRRSAKRGMFRRGAGGRLDSYRRNDRAKVLFGGNLVKDWIPLTCCWRTQPDPMGRSKDHTRKFEKTHIPWKPHGPTFQIWPLGICKSKSWMPPPTCPKTPKTSKNQAGLFTSHHHHTLHSFFLTNHIIPTIPIGITHHPTIVGLPPHRTHIIIIGTLEWSRSGRPCQSERCQRESFVSWRRPPLAATLHSHCDVSVLVAIDPRGSEGTYNKCLDVSGVLFGWTLCCTQQFLTFCWVQTISLPFNIQAGKVKPEKRQLDVQTPHFHTEKSQRSMKLYHETVVSKHPIGETNHGGPGLFEVHEDALCSKKAIWISKM